MRAAQYTGCQPGAPVICRGRHRQRLASGVEDSIKLKLRVDDYIRTVDLVNSSGLSGHRNAILDASRRPTPLVLLASRAVNGLDLVLCDFLREFLPCLSREFVRQVVAVALWLEIPNQTLARPQPKIHAVAVWRALKRKKPVIARGREQLCQIADGRLAHVSRIPRLLHQPCVDLRRTLQLGENDVTVAFNLMHGG